MDRCFWNNLSLNAIAVQTPVLQCYSGEIIVNQVKENSLFEGNWACHGGGGTMSPVFKAMYHDSSRVPIS